MCAGTLEPGPRTNKGLPNAPRKGLPIPSPNTEPIPACAACVALGPERILRDVSAAAMTGDADSEHTLEQPEDEKEPDDIEAPPAPNGGVRPGDEPRVSLFESKDVMLAA